MALETRDADGTGEARARNRGPGAGGNREASPRVERDLKTFLNELILYSRYCISH